MTHARQKADEVLQQTVSLNDRREVRKFIRFLERVKENGGDQMLAYAETYGEVVFEDKEALRELKCT